MMWAVFVVRHEDFVPNNVGVMLDCIPKHVFGVITPDAFSPEEVMHTLMFEHLVDAEKFVQNPILDGHWFCKTRYVEQQLDALSSVCQYNLRDDPAMDNCIHCHQPHERK
jgi:hypothetical protein